MGAKIVGGGLIAATLLGAFLVLSAIVSGVTAPPLVQAGEISPDYTGTAIDGSVVASDAHEGRVVMLDFWASWCPGCMASLPYVRRLSERFEARGLTVIGVSQEPDAPDRVRAIAREKALAYPIVLDSGAIRDAFRVRALPTVVLVDRKGVVRAVHAGPVTEEHLAHQIDRLLD